MTPPEVNIDPVIANALLIQYQHTLLDVRWSNPTIQQRCKFLDAGQIPGNGKGSDCGTGESTWEQRRRLGIHPRRLPSFHLSAHGVEIDEPGLKHRTHHAFQGLVHAAVQFDLLVEGDRKSTRLNSSHLVISYAVF